jgi:hypothetical protein
VGPTSATHFVWQLIARLHELATVPMLDITSVRQTHSLVICGTGHLGPAMRAVFEILPASATAISLQHRRTKWSGSSQSEAVAQTIGLYDCKWPFGEVRERPLLYRAIGSGAACGR